MYLTRLDTRTEDGWLSPVLLRWLCQRHRWLYLTNVLLSLTILVWLAARVKSMVFLIFLFTTAFGGFDTFSNSFGVQIAGFLLARPVSRRQVYHTLLLESLVSWLLLVLAPVMYILIMLFWRADRQAVSYLLPLVWALTIYLFGVCLGVNGNDEPRKTLRFRRIIMAGVLGGLLGLFAAGGSWITAGLPVALTAYEPALVITGLALAVTFYRAGWRLFRNLNF